MKPQKSAICHVIRYTREEGYRNLLGALPIAQYRENRLIDRGRVGSGISTKILGDLLNGTIAPVLLGILAYVEANCVGITRNN